MYITPPSKNFQGKEYFRIHRFYLDRLTYRSQSEIEFSKRSGKKTQYFKKPKMSGKLPPILLSHQLVIESIILIYLIFLVTKVNWFRK